MIATFEAISEEPPSSKKLSSIPTFSIPSAFSNIAQSSVWIVGAGKTKYDGWISTQEDELNLLNMEQWENLKGDKEIEAILAEHVWEHLSLEEGKEAAKNCFRFLN